VRGLVAFSLFGLDEDDIYYGGAITNAADYRKSHPDWDLWYYCGRSVPDSVVTRIRNSNPHADFEFVDEPEDQTATWWRFRAVKHSDHDFILFRDVDSRLCSREIAAVREWSQQSELPYHVIRDHPYHGRQLLAGLWGIQRSNYYELGGLSDTITGDYYQTDQLALLFQVWPICRRKIMAHIGCNWMYERMSQRRPLRVARPTRSFCGAGYYANGKMRFPEHGNRSNFDWADGGWPTDKELLANPDVFEARYGCTATVAGRSIQTKS